ncbi:unnamed protein product, partial [Tenebrio molitor]
RRQQSSYQSKVLQAFVLFLALSSRNRKPLMAIPVVNHSSAHNVGARRRRALRRTNWRLIVVFGVLIISAARKIYNRFFLLKYDAKQCSCCAIKANNVS